MEANCSESESSFITHEEDLLHCDAVFDTLTCWPKTRSSSVASAPCPKFWGDIILRPGNATRYCNVNGTWQEKSDYTQCIPLNSEDKFEEMVNIIYYVGYSTSVIALVFAIFLFLFFRGLRCLRNIIHCHLMITFVLKNVFWLKSISILPNLSPDSSVNMLFCRTVSALVNYLLVTNFFWMLVEGLYLHTVIVWAFSVDRLRLWHYVLLGWGCPAIFVIIWIPLKLAKENEDDRCWLHDGNTGYEYLFIIPIFAVLIINIIFLTSIVWVLITKLRATNSTQHCLYRKATKATLILFPLLGLTYVLFIWVPVNHRNPVAAYINALLQSTQGLFVAVFYCFLNAEVRMTIRGRLNRWSDGRSIRNTRMSMATHVEQVSLAPTASRGEKLSPLLLSRSQDDIEPSSLAIGQKLANGNVGDCSNHKTILHEVGDDIDSSVD